MFHFQNQYYLSYIYFASLSIINELKFLNLNFSLFYFHFFHFIPCDFFFPFIQQRKQCFINHYPFHYYNLKVAHYYYKSPFYHSIAFVEFDDIIILKNSKYSIDCLFRLVNHKFRCANFSYFSMASHYQDSRDHYIYLAIQSRDLILKIHQECKQRITYQNHLGFFT